MTPHPKSPKSQVLAETAYNESHFPALQLARSSRKARRIGKALFAALVLGLIAMIFVPWQQSIKGAGSVVAFQPVERTQTVKSRVKGIIAEIGDGVRENAQVKEGQLIYRIVDQDPQYLERLNSQVDNALAQLDFARKQLADYQQQLEADKRTVAAEEQRLESDRAAQVQAIAAADAYVLMAENKLESARADAQAAADAVWQTELDYERKKTLSEKGFESGMKFQEADLKHRQARAKQQAADQYVEAAMNELEGKQRERETKRQEWQAKINKTTGDLAKANSIVKKTDATIAEAGQKVRDLQNKLTEQQIKRDRQQTQEVRAPRDGYIMRLIAYNESDVVKVGDPLFTLVPETDELAVQVWVKGNDAPLIAPKDHVRLQFEGWPAAQFSGWPNVAIGTFGGEVALVDPTDDGMGMFRVLVTPDPTDEDWPEYPWLRQGVRANGWVLLDQVPLGYEVWRRMNGFPPALKPLTKSKEVKPPKIKVP